MASLTGIPAQYNKKSSAVKRIMQEARELAREPSTDFAANPLETDIFEWHFTIRGPEDTEFEGGLYHGRILLPNNYPFAPPNLMFLTPNGRFELNKKICLNITGFYPEYWQPAWGIRTVLVAVMGFLPTESKGAIGGLDTSVEARKALAIKSKAWRCSTCQLDNITIVPDVAPENVVKASLKEGEMPPDFSFGYEEDRKKEQQKKQQQQQSGESEEAKSQTSSESSGSQELPKNTQPSTTVSTTMNSDESSIGSKESISSLPASLAPATNSASPSPSTSSSAVAVPRVISSTVPQDSPRSQGSSLIQGQTQSQQNHNQLLNRHTGQRRAEQAPSTSRVTTSTHPAMGGVIQRQERNKIPLWLDAMIVGLGLILAVLVVRRFV